MQIEAFNNEMMAFIDRSSSPFHAVAELTKALDSAGFEELRESDPWQVQAGGRYWITRNDSSVIALRMPAADQEPACFGMAGAHTDSPCLRIKPNPDISLKNYQQVGVEVYGGALLAPWFDRDLSIAGRVHFLDEQGCLKQTLIDFHRPVGVIPSLAIHLDREQNQKRCINPQTELPPLIGLEQSGEARSFRDWLLDELRSQGQTKATRVLDFELSLYDVQPAAMVGMAREFLAAARLDNLLSCFVGLRALLDSTANTGALLVCNDHEEVGSASLAGAQGNFLKSVLERLYPDPEKRAMVLDRSMMISADNAHALHPNFADKHDKCHGPLLNKGPVIKTNANQRYASNSETSAHFRLLADAESVPVQDFVVRTDMACGSTIGPIAATEIGIRTLDVGIPTFAMHSCRELAGAEDGYGLYRVLRRFFETSHY